MDQQRMQARQGLSEPSAAPQDSELRFTPHGGKLFGVRWRDSVHHVQTLARHGRVPLRILRVDGACRWANRFWLQSTGCSLEQVRGSGWLDVVHPEDRERCTEVWQPAATENASDWALRQIEYRLRCANGEFGWVLELGTPRFNAQGHLAGFLGALLATPGRQMTEAAVRRYQARLRAAMAQLQVCDEQERRALACDLHDGLGQTHALALLKLADLREAAEPGLHGRIEEIQGLIEEATRAVRTITFEISPPVLHDLGLRPALNWLVENMRQRYDLDVMLIDDGHPLPFDGEPRVVLFRAIRELLINAAKHADANHVILRLTGEQDRLVVSVEDDGIGLEPAAVDPMRFGGFGLMSIHERIQHVVGGSLSIDSKPGRGTTVRLHVPLEGNHAS